MRDPKEEGEYALSLAAEDIPADRLRRDYEALSTGELTDLLLILQHGTSLWALRNELPFTALRELVVAYETDTPAESLFDRLMARVAVVQDVLRSRGVFSEEEGARRNPRHGAQPI